MSHGTGIAARAKELRVSIESLGALRDAADNLAELQHREENLQKELERLRLAARLVDDVRSRAPSLPSANSAEIGKALDALASLADSFAVDPQSVIRPEFAPIYQALKKAVVAVDGHARQLWQLLAVPIRDEIKVELLQALARITAWRDVVAGIRALQTKLEQLAALPVVTREQFDEFFHASEERNRAWERLHGAKGIPTSVVEFFRACAKDGVQLDAVSTEITDWLREKDIIQYFKVRL
jgi:hypothetical protein